MEGRLPRAQLQCAIVGTIDQRSDGFWPHVVQFRIAVSAIREFARPKPPEEGRVRREDEFVDAHRSGADPDRAVEQMLLLAHPSHALVVWTARVKYLDHLSRARALGSAVARWRGRRRRR